MGITIKRKKLKTKIHFQPQSLWKLMLAYFSMGNLLLIGVSITYFHPSYLKTTYEADLL